MNRPDGHWINLTLTVARQPDGSFAGRMSVGAAEWHVRGWHKASDGSLQAEICAPYDPDWEAVMEQFGSNVMSG